MQNKKFLTIHGDCVFIGNTAKTGFVKIKAKKEDGKTVIVLTPTTKENANIACKLNKNLNLSSIINFLPINSDGCIEIKRIGEAIKIKAKKTFDTIPLYNMKGDEIVGDYSEGCVYGDYSKFGNTKYILTLDRSNNKLLIKCDPITSHNKNGLINYNDAISFYGSKFKYCPYEVIKFVGTLNQAVKIIMSFSKQSKTNIMVRGVRNSFIVSAINTCDFCDEEILSYDFFETEDEAPELCKDCNAEIDTIEALLEMVKNLSNSNEMLAKKMKKLEEDANEQKRANEKLRQIINILQS